LSEFRAGGRTNVSRHAAFAGKAIQAFRRGITDLGTDTRARCAADGTYPCLNEIRCFTFGCITSH
jgi:hypothetical protein